MKRFICFIFLVFIWDFFHLTHCTFTIKGACAPIFTPFDEEGNLNVDIIHEYAKYLKEHEINCMLIGGTAGEGPNLSECEMKKIMHACKNASESLGMYTIGQVGGRPLKEMVELAAYAEKIRLHAILMLPTIYYKPQSEIDLVRIIMMVSLAAPNMPILYYNNPKYSDVNLDMVKVFKMSSQKVPHFKGMKCSLDVALRIRASVDMKRDQRIFVDDDRMVGAAMCSGFDSIITSGLSIFPQLINEIIELAAAGDSYGTIEKQTRLNKLFYIIESFGPLPAPGKEAMTLVTGINVGKPRAPLHTMNQRQLNEMKNGFRKLGIRVSSKN